MFHNEQQHEAPRNQQLVGICPRQHMIKQQDLPPAAPLRPPRPAAGMQRCKDGARVSAGVKGREQRGQGLQEEQEKAAGSTERPGQAPVRGAHAASSEGGAEQVIRCCLIYSEDLNERLGDNCRQDRAEHRGVSLLVFVYHINRRIM